MEMEPVNSSNLSAVGYDSESATLRIQFIKGALYEYQGVPTDVYQGLMEAPSKGTYFNTYIKNGGYPFGKI